MFHANDQDKTPLLFKNFASTNPNLTVEEYERISEYFTLACKEIVDRFYNDFAVVMLEVIANLTGCYSINPIREAELKNSDG